MPQPTADGPRAMERKIVSTHAIISTHALLNRVHTTARLGSDTCSIMALCKCSGKGGQKERGKEAMIDLTSDDGSGSSRGNDGGSSRSGKGGQKGDAIDLTYSPRISLLWSVGEWEDASLGLGLGLGA